MRLAEKRKQVMFAQAEEFDVLDHHHFVIGHAERRAIQHGIQILVIPAGEELEGLLETFRCLAQSFAIRIFTDQGNHLADQIGNLLLRECQIGLRAK